MKKAASTIFSGNVDYPIERGAEQSCPGLGQIEVTPVETHISTQRMGAYLDRRPDVSASCTVEAGSPVL